MKSGREATSGEGRGSGARGPIVLTWPPSAEDLAALEVFELKDPAELKPLPRPLPRPVSRSLSVRPPEYVPGPGHGAPKTSVPGPSPRPELPLVWPPPDEDDLAIEVAPAPVNEADIAPPQQARIESARALAAPADTADLVAEAVAAPVGHAFPPRRRTGLWRTLTLAASAMVLLGGAFWGAQWWSRMGPGDLPAGAPAPSSASPEPAAHSGEEPSSASPPPVPVTPAPPAAGSALPGASATPSPSPRSESLTVIQQGPSSEATALSAFNTAPEAAPAGDTAVTSGLPAREDAATPVATDVPGPPRDEPEPVPARDLSPSATPAPLTPPPSPVIPQDRDPQAEVREALASYRAAYGSLDASAARRVWPSVDEGALARAFAGLKSQRIEFDTCEVVTRPDSATASCQGRAVYVRQVGRQDPQVEPRRWRFTLRPTAAGWRIERAEIDR